MVPLQELKITSNMIKAGLMAYYRFGSGCEMLAPELSYGIGIADLMVITKKEEVVEVEIKVDKYDLLGEAKNKQIKHLLLEKAGKIDVPVTQSYCNCRPNRFYYCVPEYLVEDAIQFATKQNNNYGVMLFTPTKHPQDCIEVVKRSHKLHEQPVAEYFREYIAKRMSNDLCVWYRDEYWPVIKKVKGQYVYDDKNR